MISIPHEYTACIKQVIEWHLATYMPDKGFDAELDKVLVRFYERNLIDGAVQVEEKHLYHLYECVSNATNNVSHCGLEEECIWEIYNWIRPLYFQTKT